MMPGRHLDPRRAAGYCGVVGLVGDDASTRIERNAAGMPDVGRVSHRLVLIGPDIHIAVDANG
jgi:hypothetical protein